MAQTSVSASQDRCTRIRVVVVDDHEIFRQGLRALLEHDPDIEVVGEARDGRSAVRMVGTLRPDVVTMKVRLPELNGIDATRRILDQSPRPRVLALSLRVERDWVIGMLDAGASGYLTRACDSEECIGAIRALAAGRMSLCREAADVVFDECVRRVRRSADPLSVREREILKLIAEGLSPCEIARKLFISTKTVETHRRKIMMKIDERSVAGLTKYAIKHGLTTLG